MLGTSQLANPCWVPVNQQSQPMLGTSQPANPCWAPVNQQTHAGHQSTHAGHQSTSKPMLGTSQPANHAGHQSTSKPGGAASLRSTELDQHYSSINPPGPTCNSYWFMLEFSATQKIMATIHQLQPLVRTPSQPLKTSQIHTNRIDVNFQTTTKVL